MTDQNKSVTIDDAWKLAELHDNQAVVIIGVERDGTVTVVSYGENKFKCGVIGRWAQGLFNYAVSAVPFRTAFGWGNLGKPEPLSKNERLSIPREQHAYIDENTAPEARAK